MERRLEPVLLGQGCLCGCPPAFGFLYLSLAPFFSCTHSSSSSASGFSISVANLSMVCGLDYFGLMWIEAPDYAAVSMSVEMLRS